MNLVKFMSRVDELTGSYDREQLICFIHETARTLPEEMRNDFIKKLESASVGNEKDEVEIQQNTLKELYDEMNSYIEEIESGECYLHQEWNEEYDDWYNSDADEVLYEDPDKVARRIISVCYYIHDCKDAGNYKIAEELGRKLFALQIYAYGDYGEETLSVSDMQHYDLLPVNLRNVALDTLYSCYMSRDGKELSEIMYEVFSDSKMNDLYMEDLLQYADEELKNFQQFLPEWISYLGGITGKAAERLFAEAVELSDDINVQLKYAQNYAANHPGIYKKLLDDGNNLDVDKKIEIGMDGINRIKKSYLVRSDVALKTAEFILVSGKEDFRLQSCYIAAFESDTNAVNYLRAFLNSNDQSAVKKLLKDIFANYERKSDSFFVRNTASELAKNEPSKNMIYILRLLNGEFMDVLQEGVNAKESLGWSGTFMKEGLAFLLLYLYDGPGIPKGISTMLHHTKINFGFTYEKYSKGQLLKNHGDETVFFYDCFLRWKSTESIDDADKGKILAHIEKKLEKRVAGIMEANRRNYYGECAAYIAAVGEVKEAYGKTGEKQRYMGYYKNKYSRRYAFRGELERYGWIK